MTVFLRWQLLFQLLTSLPQFLPAVMPAFSKDISHSFDGHLAKLLQMIPSRKLLYQHRTKYHIVLLLASGSTGLLLPSKLVLSVCSLADPFVQNSWQLRNYVCVQLHWQRMGRSTYTCSCLLATSDNTAPSIPGSCLFASSACQQHDGADVSMRSAEFDVETTRMSENHASKTTAYERRANKSNGELYTPRRHLCLVSLASGCLTHCNRCSAIRQEARPKSR